jgi:hypothetical protein
MSYTIEEFTQIFDIGRAYYYELKQRGEGPLITWAGAGKPRIRLEDALAWAERRIDRVAAKHRPRYEAGIRKIQIDMVLAKNAQAKADAAARSEQRKVAAKKPKHDALPPSRIGRKATPQDAGDWLPVAHTPSYWR